MKLRHPTPIATPGQRLAELVREPASPPEFLDPRLHRVLAARIAARAPGRHLGSIRIDSHVLLEGPYDATPFRWSPRTARRLLGAAALRRVIEGTCSNPLSAVRAEIDEVVARALREHTRPGSLGTWLGESPHSVRAAALGEAVTWTTDLLVYLGPLAVMGGLSVGRADPVWAVPGAPWISLRGRIDAEVRLDVEMRTRALLCVRGGRPSGTAAADLGFVGLVDALTQPGAPLATRVIGIWPSAGRMISLELEAEDLRRAARTVVGAVERRRTAPAVAA